MAGLLSIDNLDDRREVIVLLDKLRPPDRWRWLRWVARQARQTSGKTACEVTFTDADRRFMREALYGINSANQFITNSTYYHSFQLATQYGLDFAKLVICLEKLVRGELEPEDLGDA